MINREQRHQKDTKRPCLLLASTSNTRGPSGPHKHNTSATIMRGLSTMGAHHLIGYGPSYASCKSQKCIESNHGAPLNRCPLRFGVSLFVPGLPDTKLKISRAESRNVTEPKVATPRRSTRIAHLNAVPPREALRTALVWAKLALSSTVPPRFAAARLSAEFAAGILFSPRLRMGPPDSQKRAARNICVVGVLDVQW